ncbi:MAG: adenylate cyclase, partial [Candidatus Azotimanducaceae bacterium]
MAEIFLSYASEDRQRVIPLVEAIEHQGYSIWWDRKLAVGTAFDREIEIEIDQAKCILVIWSKNSLQSDWVRAEANEGLENSSLVPILIDDVKPPLAFRMLQTPRLIGWPKVRSAEALNLVLSAINQKLSPLALRDDQIIESESLLPDKSIAVLPFRSLSPNPVDLYFAQGLADEIRLVLSQIPDLEVASSTSSQQFEDGSGGSASAIGTQLNVNFLLEGSVRKSGEKLRITVQFIQASDGYVLWSKTYNDTLDDIFKVQDEIAGRVANALKSTLWETVLEHQARNRTENTQAYQEYLLAMHYNREMHQGGGESLDLVRKHAENAVKLDTDFISAWVLLADVYLNRMGYRMPLAEAHPLAKNALDNAIRLDPDNPDVLLQLAELTRGDHNYEKALEMYQRARELDR